jgi:hypothetical protein
LATAVNVVSTINGFLFYHQLCGRDVLPVGRQGKPNRRHGLSKVAASAGRDAVAAKKIGAARRAADGATYVGAGREGGEQSSGNDQKLHFE